MLASLLGRRRSPLDPPPSLSSRIGLIVYIILVLVSIWASGKSLVSHFGLEPSILGYAFGLVFALAAAMLLLAYEKIRDERSILKVLGIGVLFLLVWALSLLTNTHSFFMLSNLDRMQKEELKDASKELGLISSETTVWFDDFIANYETEVNDQISQFREQVLDENNFGLGMLAQGEITELGNRLGTPLTPLSAPPSSNRAAVVEVMNQYIRNAEGVRDRRVDEMFEQKQRALQELDVEKAAELVEDLETYKEYFSDYSSEQVAGLLERAFEEVDKQSSIVRDVIGIPELTSGSTLPKTPVSSQLMKIDKLIGYLRNNWGGSSGVIFAFAIAFAIDLTAFVILWKFVIND
jgi:hypothetical protein